jgi:diguanylate cyclase (GGDEF)-like protein
VLLIEHDPQTAGWIREMLRSTWDDGLEVAQSTSLAEAVEDLADHPASCILLDVSAWGQEWLDAMEQVRAAAPDVPILVLADDAQEENALRAVRAGMQDYLIKDELYPALLRRAVVHAIERKRSEVQLAYQALHDSLTGLPNRTLFLDRLRVALDRLRRSRSSVAVLFLDVDNFKQINDTLGHAAGDQLLVALADRLRTMLRPMDTVARFGGDEFTFLFEELASEREVVMIADRISRITQVPIELEEGPAMATVSIGIAIASDPSISPETMIREADAAMYRAKDSGRSRYELFDEVSRHRATERLELESDLRHAVDRSELRLFYQPTISLHDHATVTGLEALVRWQHPERGLMSPTEFIPLAEETGLMAPIGQYVLEQSLRQVTAWRRHSPDVTVSVNVSFRQLEDLSLLTMMAAAIRATGVDPSALCVEIAEGALTRNPEAATRVLQGLKAMGVRVAIDDFGTAASSLPNLKRLPIDSIKMHESVVGGLGRDPEERPIVSALVALGHALGLGVSAEGVETELQLSELRALGVDNAQGFLLGRPVPEEEVQALLDAHPGRALEGSAS